MVPKVLGLALIMFVGMTACREVPYCATVNLDGRAALLCSDRVQYCREHYARAEPCARRSDVYCYRAANGPTGPGYEVLVLCATTPVGCAHLRDALANPPTRDRVPGARPLTLCYHPLHIDDAPLTDEQAAQLGMSPAR